MAFKSSDVAVTMGTPKVHASSEHARRLFCGECGTGLFYTNEVVLPGLTDVQAATLDKSEENAPAMHVQYAEHLSWTDTLNELPRFDRYPTE
jgi:hypothetical protein